MSRLNYFFIVNLMFIVLVGCSEENILPESIYSVDDISLKNDKADHFAPFKATFEVSVDKVTHFPPPPPKTQKVIGFGNTTHLGKTEMLINQSWWPPTDQIPPFVLPYTGTGIGTITFSSANGDMLLAEYNDATGLHKTKTLVIVKFTGHFLDGGTGRFEKAQGSFEYYGIYNPVTNYGKATLTGEIMYHK